MTLESSGRVLMAGRSQTCALGEAIAGGVLTLRHLIDRLALPIEAVVGRVVIGVDAPLGLPREFVAATQAGILRMPQTAPLPTSMIESKLVYRDTERRVFTAFRGYLPNGWRPLSPSFASMGSNITKARFALSQLRSNERAGMVCLVPFEKDTGTVAAIEVYPALWNAVASHPRFAQLGQILSATDRERSPHVRDAARCALLAACYEATRRKIATSLPSVAMPDTVDDAEGWIFAPVL